MLAVLNVLENWFLLCRGRTSVKEGRCVEYETNYKKYKNQNMSKRKFAINDFIHYRIHIWKTKVISVTDVSTIEKIKNSIIHVQILVFQQSKIYIFSHNSSTHLHIENII